ncbi:MAG TPA: HEAT repeat domain-containing protein [Chryseosolibacter sp.]
MEKARIQELIFKYNTEQASAAEVKEIEQLLEAGIIDLDALQEISKMEKAVAKIKTPEPGADLDHRFYQMLALEKGSKGSFSWREFFSWPQLAPKLALASFMLVIGIGVGYLIKPSAPANDQMAELSQQVIDLKEMMMLSMLEKESATERLKAVSLTSEMSSASQQVTNALLETLNKDENLNVRLAALEALKPYSKNSAVREALIRSIANQESPLVQVALAETMAELQVKSSVSELKKILESEKTPADAKSRIKQSIDVLI